MNSLGDDVRSLNVMALEQNLNQSGDLPTPIPIRSPKFEPEFSVSYAAKSLNPRKGLGYPSEDTHGV